MNYGELKDSACFGQRTTTEYGHEIWCKSYKHAPANGQSNSDKGVYSEGTEGAHRSGGNQEGRQK